MGSGVTRAFWQSHGSRSGRKSNTKSLRAQKKGDGGRKKIKALRVQAKRIASGEEQWPKENAA
jgi:hypothetical protein